MQRKRCQSTRRKSRFSGSSSARIPLPTAGRIRVSSWRVSAGLTSSRSHRWYPHTNTVCINIMRITFKNWSLCPSTSEVEFNVFRIIEMFSFQESLFKSFVLLLWAIDYHWNASGMEIFHDKPRDRFSFRFCQMSRTSNDAVVPLKRRRLRKCSNAPLLFVSLFTHANLWSLSLNDGLVLAIHWFDKESCPIAAFKLSTMDIICYYLWFDI